MITVKYYVVVNNTETQHLEEKALRKQIGVYVTDFRRHKSY